MSLLFERAIRAFSPTDAEHVRATPDDSGRDDARDPDRLDYLARLASSRHRELAPAGRGDSGDGDSSDSATDDAADRVPIPLHDPESAELSDEYVAFERHPVRGDILVYRDAETDEDRPLSFDAASRTDLARRLRFWLPGNTPDERPSYAREGPSGAVSPANPVPPGERDAYFDRLAAFVAEEREAERRRNRERARRRTPRELAERGEAAIPELTGFSALADGGIECFVNEGSSVDVRDRYGVYEDDEVLLHAPPDTDPDDVPVEFPLELTVRRITDRTLDLTPRESTPNLDAVADFLDGADGVGLSLLLNPTVHDREEAAVRSVRNDADRRATVVGAADASFAAERAVETERRDDQLDEAQTLAAAAGLYAEDVCCIHGPPGTGKTRVLGR